MQRQQKLYVTAEWRFFPKLGQQTASRVLFVWKQILHSVIPSEQLMVASPVSPCAAEKVFLPLVCWLWTMYVLACCFKLFFVKTETLLALWKLKSSWPMVAPRLLSMLCTLCFKLMLSLFVLVVSLDHCWCYETSFKTFIDYRQFFFCLCPPLASPKIQAFLV